MSFCHKTWYTHAWKDHCCYGWWEYEISLYLYWKYFTRSLLALTLGTLEGIFFNAKRPFNTVSILSLYFSVSSMKISLSFWHFEVKMKRCLLERNYLVFSGFCSLNCVHLPLSSPESIQLRDPIRGTLSSRFFFSTVRALALFVRLLAKLNQVNCSNSNSNSNSIERFCC